MATTRDEGPAAAASLRRGGDGCQLSTFEFALKWLISATMYDEQAGIAYSRCGHTKASYSGMKDDFKRSWKE